jgi:hypothetical protein
MLVSEVGSDFWLIIGFKILHRHSTNMESQRIVELLLSMQAENKAWRERMENNRQADRETMKTNQDDLIKRMKTYVTGSE